MPKGCSFLIMKRIFLLICALILSGCSNKIQYYTKSFPDYLDTMTTYITYASSEDDFEKQCQYIEKRLQYYDKLFDNYHTYPSIVNVMTINQNAGKKAVVVDQELFDLLKLSKERYQNISPQVNIAYGSVLTLWHEAREQASKHKNIGQPPSKEELEKASGHTNINQVILDEKKRSVYLEDPEMALDLGAVAKGYTMEKIKQGLIKQGVKSFLLNGGGNVVGVGQRLVASEEADYKACRSHYCIGIASPKDGNYASTKSDYEAVLVADNKAVVTSGDYERYFLDAQGNRYCHLIDPLTSYPAHYMRSVTIITKDSGLADYLSSALFLMSYENGQKLIASLDDVEAIWLLNDGHIMLSEGMKNKDFYVFQKERMYN